VTQETAQRPDRITRFETEVVLAALFPDGQTPFRTEPAATPEKCGSGPVAAKSQNGSRVVFLIAPAGQPRDVEKAAASSKKGRKNQRLFQKYPHLFYRKPIQQFFVGWLVGKNAPLVPVNRELAHGLLLGKIRLPQARPSGGLLFPRCFQPKEYDDEPFSTTQDVSNWGSWFFDEPRTGRFGPRCTAEQKVNWTKPCRWAVRKNFTRDEQWFLEKARLLSWWDFQGNDESQTW